MEKRSASTASTGAPTRAARGQRNSSRDKNIDDPQQISVQADLVENLYSLIPTSAAGHVFLAVLMCTVLWESVGHSGLPLWGGVRIAYALVQPGLLRAYNKRKPRDRSARRWGLYMVAFAVPSGVLWGLPALLFLNPDVPINMITIMVVLMGIGLGAVAVDAGFPAVFFAFNLPIQGLLVAGILIHQPPSEAALTLLVLLSLALSINQTRVVHQALESSARLRWQNLQLRREAEEKSLLLESTLENMDQGIAVFDPRGGLRMRNRRFLQLLGIPAGQDSHAPEPGENMQRLWERVQPPLPEVISGRTEYRRGNEVLEIRQTRAPDDSRVLTFTDISVLKQRESALERANAAKTRFLAAASHDLRQPIHALGLFCSALSSQVRGEEPRRIMVQIDTTIGVIAVLYMASVRSSASFRCSRASPISSRTGWTPRIFLNASTAMHMPVSSPKFSNCSSKLSW